MRLKVSSRALSPSGSRDPQAATQNLRYSSVGTPMVLEWDAETAIRFAYLVNVVVYRCVWLIADTIRMVPIRAGADPLKPQDFNVNSPLAKMLGPPPGGPAPGISARKLLGNALAQFLVTGRFGWEIELGQKTGNPIALWPLVSTCLYPESAQGGTNYFRSFRYTTPKGNQVLPPKQVFYYWRPSLHDWRQPESALQAARLDISVAVMQDRYDHAFLRNDARPAGIVVHEAFAEKDDYEAFKQQFTGEYGGPENAGKLAFVEAEPGEQGGVSGSVAFKQLGLSQRDADFIKRHEAKFRNIAIALGVPWSKLDASGRTFNNAGAEDNTFWVSTILPLLLDLQDAFNIDLAPRMGSDLCWFDLSTVEALQKEQKYFAVTGVPMFVQAQLMTINEGRAAVGLPPMPDGNRVMTPEEIQALKGSPAPAPIRGKDAGSSSVPTPPSERRPAPSKVSSKASNGSHYSARESDPTPTAPTVDHQVRRTKIWRGFDSQAKTLERAWQRSFAALFKRQQAAVLNRLEGKRGRQAIRAAELDAGKLFDRAYWIGETRELVHPLFESVFAAGAARLAADFSRSKAARPRGIETRADDTEFAFDVEDPWVQDHIAARSNQLAGDVSDTTYESVKGTMADGVGEGESVPDLAKRIRGVFDQADKVRSKRIARTEVVGAYNGSANMLGRQLGGDIVAGKEWIATRDQRTREDHGNADGQIRNMDEAFDVGGAALEFPGDPAGAPGDIVNCRCTMALLTPEEMESRSARVSLTRAEDALVGLALGRFSPEQFADIARAG